MVYITVHTHVGHLIRKEHPTTLPPSLPYIRVGVNGCALERGIELEASFVEV
jgi:hypothetical protein